MKTSIKGTLALFELAWRTSPGKLGLSLVLMVLQAVSMPLAAPAIAATVDNAIAGDARGATLAALLVAGLVIASLTAGHFAHIAYFELGDLAFIRLERDLVALTNGSVGLAHQERPEHADRLEVVRTELHRAGWGSMEALLSSIGIAIAAGVTGVLLAQLDPWLLLLPLAAVPSLIAGRRAEDVKGDAREAAAQRNRQARHLLHVATDAEAAKELRVTGAVDRLAERYTRAWDAATTTIWAGEVRAAWWRAGGQLVFAAAYVGATLLVVQAAVAGDHGVGAVVLVITLAAQVNQQVTAVVTVLQQLQRAARTMVDLDWVRELVRSERASGSQPAPESLTTGLTLEGVTFSYPGTERVVLRDVDLALPRGATVAIVGENGAGKSSLVKLLCRFYEPGAGRVLVDGVDLSDIDPVAWRTRVTAGFQDFARFELVARESIGLGLLEDIDSADAVGSAVGRARAEAVVARLEDGLDTQLGVAYADGAPLSGGQWQKVALARAMMREAPLLMVLDEPSSALDAEAEHELFEHYAEVASEVAERTGGVTVLVTHRFTTVRTADLIVVLDAGGVREVGSHAELLARDGLYSELFRLQAASYR